MNHILINLLHWQLLNRHLLIGMLELSPWKSWKLSRHRLRRSLYCDCVIIFHASCVNVSETYPDNGIRHFHWIVYVRDNKATVFRLLSLLSFDKTKIYPHRSSDQKLFIGVSLLAAISKCSYILIVFVHLYILINKHITNFPSLSLGSQVTSLLWFYQSNSRLKYYQALRPSYFEEKKRRNLWF